MGSPEAKIVLFVGQIMLTGLLNIAHHSVETIICMVSL